MPLPVPYRYCPPEEGRGKEGEVEGWHFPIRLLLDLPSNSFVKEVREMLGECTGLSSPLSCMYQLI